jgi:hypothetical protein
MNVTLVLVLLAALVFVVRVANLFVTRLRKARQ